MCVKCGKEGECVANVTRDTFVRDPNLTYRLISGRGRRMIAEWGDGGGQGRSEGRPTCEVHDGRPKMSVEDMV